MMVQGSECSIVIKTTHCEMDVPYSEETIREAVSFIQEEASIEGIGVCGGIRINRGVIGCVVTPLTIYTVPLFLYLAMGSIGNPVYVSETRNVYRNNLNLLPMEDTESFDLIQDRGNERKLFEGCRAKGFELRIMRGEAVKLKLDICGENPAVVFPFINNNEIKSEELFNCDSVTYKINNQEYKNIYGMTLLTKKESGIKTELLIKRVLENTPDIPEIIDEMTITAQLTRTQYEQRFYGMFRITIKKLVFLSDETIVETADAVIGPLRYYVTDSVFIEVFSSSEGFIP